MLAFVPLAAAGPAAEAGPMTTAPSPPPGPEDPHHIGILLFDGVEELDAVGPWEVLAWWTRSFPEDGYTASMLLHRRQRRHLQQGAGHPAPPLPRRRPEMAVLVHPGGDTRALSADAEHLEWLRKQRTVVPLLTSVCTGSLVYAKAGPAPRPPGHDVLGRARAASPRTTPPSRSAPTPAGSTTAT